MNQKKPEKENTETHEKPDKRTQGGIPSNPSIQPEPTRRTWKKKETEIKTGGRDNKKKEK